MQIGRQGDPIPAWNTAPRHIQEVPLVGGSMSPSPVARRYQASTPAFMPGECRRQVPLAVIRPYRGSIMPSGHPARYSPPTDPLTLTSQERIETFLTRQDWAIMLSVQTASRHTPSQQNPLPSHVTSSRLIAMYFCPHPIQMTTGRRR